MPTTGVLLWNRRYTGGSWSRKLARTQGGALSRRQLKQLRIDVDFASPIYPYSYKDQDDVTHYEIGTSTSMLVNMPFFSNAGFYYGTDENYIPALRVPISGNGAQAIPLSQRTQWYVCDPFTSAVGHSMRLCMIFSGELSRYLDGNNVMSWSSPSLTLLWEHFSHESSSTSNVVMATCAISDPHSPRLRFGHDANNPYLLNIGEVFISGRSGTFWTQLKQRIAASIQLRCTCTPA